MKIIYGIKDSEIKRKKILTIEESILQESKKSRVFKKGEVSVGKDKIGGDKK